MDERKKRLKTIMKNTSSLQEKTSICVLPVAEVVVAIHITSATGRTHLLPSNCPMTPASQKSMGLDLGPLVMVSRLLPWSLPPWRRI